MKFSEGLTALMMHYHGYEIFESAFHTIRTWTRKPRTKKRRILKKWMKREKNYTYAPDPKVYVVNSIRGRKPFLVMHPVVAQKLRYHLQKMRLEKHG